MTAPQRWAGGEDRPVCQGDGWQRTLILGRNTLPCGCRAGGAAHSQEAAGPWGGCAGVPQLVSCPCAPEASLLVMPCIGSLDKYL